jgi:hypothetical protein
MKRYTTISDDNLKRYLQKIRRISKLEDDDAIEELDEFLFNITDQVLASVINESKDESKDENDDDYNAKFCEKELNNFRLELEKYVTIDRSNVYSARYLRDASQELGYYWSPKYQIKYSQMLTELKNEAEKIANDCEIKAPIFYIQNTSKKDIRVFSSINLIIRKLDHYETILKNKSALTEDLSQRIIEIKKDCAWFRANKKLAEAEVAKGGKNEKKYLKLIGEAEVILKQDWCSFLPDFTRT